ncbi:hypothetical protein B0H12DRAFT_1077220 [Mycena haematopus]|nr:hypothetical protein B0H12DRAFT_1077220 [Mycena haematopus]
MATTLPSSWSSNNLFRTSASVVAQPPTAAPPFVTPARRPEAVNAQPSHPPRPYVPGCNPVRVYANDSAEASPYSSDSDGHLTDVHVPPLRCRRRDRGRVHESASGYVAEQGPLLKPFNLHPGTWKEEDKLSLERGNYRVWAKNVYSYIGLQSGASRWLDPSEPCPSFEMYPRAHRIWMDNDVAIRSFLFLTCASSYDSIYR